MNGRKKWLPARLHQRGLAAAETGQKKSCNESGERSSVWLNLFCGGIRKAENNVACNGLVA